MFKSIKSAYFCFSAFQIRSGPARISGFHLAFPWVLMDCLMCDYSDLYFLSRALFKADKGIKYFMINSTNAFFLESGGRYGCSRWAYLSLEMKSFRWILLTLSQTQNSNTLVDVLRNIKSLAKPTKRKRNTCNKIRLGCPYGLVQTDVHVYRWIPTCAESYTCLLRHSSKNIDAVSFIEM